jgi:hypothetical protein
MTEESAQRDYRQLREQLSRAFSFVRSVEINRKLAAITFDDLLAEAYTLLDDSAITAELDIATTDAGRVAFVQGEDELTGLRRRGKLQRLASLAGDVLDEATFGSIFTDLQRADVSQVTDTSSLFDRLKEFDPTEIALDSEYEDEDDGSKLVEIQGSVVLQDGEEQIDIFVTEEALETLAKAQFTATEDEG